MNVATSEKEKVDYLTYGIVIIFNSNKATSYGIKD